MKIFSHSWNDHQTVYINDEAGFCKVNIYKEKRRRVAELYNLIVYPALRGTGVGDMLLREAIKVAHMFKCDIMVLWPDCEFWVKDWYSRNGFVPNSSILNASGEIGWCKQLKKKP